jgi:DNA (cytosine-5)-methyltransferase 1
MKFLSLFAGIGGFDLGLERAGMECAGQVEIDPFCRQVLARHWPKVKRIGDIREVRGNEFGAIDLVCGGYPCQPFSSAGKRRGHKDDRYLWPEMFRLIKAIRPAWVIGENVIGHLSMGLDQVLADLESEKYTCRPFIIPACAVDAPHRRNRIWIVAYTIRDEYLRPQRAGLGIPESVPQFNRSQDHSSGESGGAGKARIANKEYVAHSKGLGWEQGNSHDGGRGEGTGAAEEWGGSSNCGQWEFEPGMGRVADGVPRRMDRLRALGNSVVPQIVEIIGRGIMRYEQNKD